MGRLLPAGYDLTQLRNDAERSVVEACLSQLTDGWFVIPSLKLVEHRDYELDVVLVHVDYGIFDIEVKGHKVSIKEGVWRSHGSRMNPQPMDQARTNAHALRRKLRLADPVGLGHIEVRYAVALPNTVEIDGNLPLDVLPEQILIESKLDDLFTSLTSLAAVTPLAPLNSAEVELAISHICPDVNFEWDFEAEARRTRARLDEICATNVRALERLDSNRRVIVTGGAGTGKSRLAVSWAIRASVRGERVMLTCFNEPLADQLREHFEPEVDEGRAGAFFPTAMNLEGMPTIVRPESLNPTEEQHFWKADVIGHLIEHLPSVTERFDTIIVDEAQDFSPAWIAFLEALLDPEGPKKLLMVGDSEQDIFDRGMRLPQADDGWTVCELVNNCRNSFQIARLLRRILHGAPAPMIGPESSGISFVESTDGYITAVRGILRSGSPDGVNLSGSIAVITYSRGVRDELRSQLDLGDWESRKDKTVCESVRRLKGTEFDSVVIVDPYGEMDKGDLYVAVSRAVSTLVVVGPRSLGEMLQLTI